MRLLKVLSNFLIATQIDSGQPYVVTYTGGFRTLDCIREPFRVLTPMHRIVDDAISENRSLAVWRLDDLAKR